MNIAFWIEIALAAALLIAGAIVGIHTYFSFAKLRLNYERAVATIASGAFFGIASYRQDVLNNIVFALCAAAFLALAIYAKKLTDFYEDNGSKIHAYIGAFLMAAVIIGPPGYGLPLWLTACVTIGAIILIAPFLFALYKESAQMVVGVAGIPSDMPESPEVAESLAEAEETASTAVPQSPPPIPAEPVATQATTAV